MSRSRKMVFGLGADYTSAVVNVVLKFATTPIVLGLLGSYDYGLWALFGQVLGYLAVADFGITGALKTYIARVAHEGDQRELSILVTNGIVAQIGVASLFTILGLLAGFALPGFFEVPSDRASIVFLAFSLTILARALSIPASGFASILEGHQLVATSRLINTGASLLNALLSVLFLYLGIGLVSLPLSGIVASVVQTLVSLTRIKRLVPDLAISRQFISRARLRELIGSGWWWWLASLGAVVAYQTENILVGKLFGPEAVTTYVLTLTAARLGSGELLRTVLLMRPFISDAFGRGDEPFKRQSFIKGLKYLFLIASTFAVILCFTNRYFVSAWVGPDQYAGDWLTAVVALGIVPSTIYKYSWGYVTANLQPKSVAILRAIEGLLGIGLSLLASKVFGLVGVPLGILLASALTTAWYAPLKAAQTMNIPPSELLKRSFLKPLIAIAIITPIIWFTMQHLQPPQNPLTTGLLIVGISLVAFPLALIIAQDRQECAWVWQRLLGSLRKAGITRT